jgi:PilZ domain
MDRPMIDRRLDARFGHPLLAGTQAILRPGYAVALIDLSCGGALIQGPRPLRPGARVHLHLTIASRRLGIGAQVLRCAVASLEAGEGVQYRGALKFDQRCDTLWEPPTLDGYSVPWDSGDLPHALGQGLPGPPAVAGSVGDRDDK